MRRTGTAAALFLLAACAEQRVLVVPVPQPPVTAGSLQLAGQFSLPPQTLFPPFVGVMFGGISGLAPADVPGEFFAACDRQLGSRVYRMRLSGEGPAFRAEPVRTIPLEIGDRAPRVDPEAIAVGPSGDIWIASEGIAGVEPRIPPAILRYTPNGRFVGQLELRERFVPNLNGPITRGLRSNAALESLTMSPGGGRLFTASETALAQDGEPASFEHGTLARLLEYTAGGGSFQPAREFVYPLDAIEKVSFEAGVAIMGVVELLALSDTELLSLERTYIERVGRPGEGVNQARVYRVSIDAATDVSSIDSLKDAPGAVPVRKTLVLDLSAVPGLSPDLAPSLDNFEGLSFGPRLADGRASLVLVSDDNFSEHQRTWFLLFAVGAS